MCMVSTTISSSRRWVRDLWIQAIIFMPSISVVTDAADSRGNIPSIFASRRNISPTLTRPFPRCGATEMSTGGLTVILYAADRGARIGVDRVVTDSPFLAWNFSPFMRNIAIPAVSFFGLIDKNGKIKQSRCDGYAYSLLKEYHGYWTYNTDWKMIYSPPVTMSWVRAISKAQKEVKKNRKNIVVPLLVMHSSRKIDGCNWTPEFQTGDCVLDPFAIQKIGVTLGADLRQTEVCAIDSGVHDLILSFPRARDAAYDSIFSFIRRH